MSRQPSPGSRSRRDASRPESPAKRKEKTRRKEKEDRVRQASVTAGSPEPRSRGDTRQRLLESAIQLIAEDETGLAGLSLRQVTKGAGVSPTAFYRHFPDMEELGLAILDETTELLRRMLREVRKAGTPEEMVGGSVRILMEFVTHNRSRFIVMSRERNSGSARMREAVRNQVAYFATELASDLRLLNVFPQLTTTELNRVASMVINLAVYYIPDILDLPPGQPQTAAEMADDLKKQLMILLLGAGRWNAEGGKT